MKTILFFALLLFASAGQEVKVYKGTSRYISDI